MKDSTEMLQRYFVNSEIIVSRLVVSGAKVLSIDSFTAFVQHTNQQLARKNSKLTNSSCSLSL